MFLFMIYTHKFIYLVLYFAVHNPDRSAIMAPLWQVHIHTFYDSLAEKF